MRGVSNLISALFVVAIILIIAYSLTTAYFKYSLEITKATKEVIERKIHANNIAYSIAECNVESKKISLKYMGTNPEYFVRFICYDKKDPYNSLCMVPSIKDGTNYIKYINKNIPKNIELNIATCEGLENACSEENIENIKCIVVGIYSLKEIAVVKS